MESRREKPQKALESNAQQKPKRFRIVKLEERIAPARGGKVTKGGCFSQNCDATSGYCDSYLSCLC